MVENASMPRQRPYTATDVLELLRISEGPGPGEGHTLARHVNISNPDLIRRVDEDTRNGAIANYGAFREKKIDDAAVLGAWLLNSPAGINFLKALDKAVDDKKNKRPGTPLPADKYPDATLKAPAPAGWLMRWVQVGSMVIEVPAGDLTMVVNAVKGGDIRIVTFYPVFLGGQNVTIKTLYRAK
jgi:hypothetical protein